MRRLITIPCEGVELGASVDGADGRTGLLFVTGGTQTRIGSHRLFERLAAALAREGIPCFRFDRRGVGDSDGEDPGWRGSAADLSAATAAFRQTCPQVGRIVGLGLCDGATALTLFGDRAGVDALILLNPWLVEVEPGEQAPAAIRHHYQEQLRSAQGWRKILYGSVSWAKVFKGLRAIAASVRSPLSDEVASALRTNALPAEAILASRDGTAIAAREEFARPALAAAITRPPTQIETASHTFAAAGDFDRLLGAIRESVARLARCLAHRPQRLRPPATPRTRPRRGSARRRARPCSRCRRR